MTLKAEIPVVAHCNLIVESPSVALTIRGIRERFTGHVRAREIPADGIRAEITAHRNRLSRDSNPLCNRRIQHR